MAAVEDMMGVEGSGCVPKLEQIRVLREAGISITPAENGTGNIYSRSTPSENEVSCQSPYTMDSVYWPEQEGAELVYRTGDRECIYQWIPYGRY